MKIIRYEDQGGTVRHGTENTDGSIRRLNGDIFGEYSISNDVDQPRRLLAPVAPSQILCIGLNYRQHAEESGLPIPKQPVLFMKGINSVQHPRAPILIPSHLPSVEVDYEVELAVVIGRSCKNATRENALSHVLGYTCANDVSARDWQLKYGGGQWCRGKTFDTFCPLGPCLVTTDEIPNPNELKLEMQINGETVQSSNTHDMIFDVADLIVFLSGSATLLPGTVILTGTPQGVGMAHTPPRWLKPGDIAVAEIDKIGRLENPVNTE